MLASSALKSFTQSLRSPLPCAVGVGVVTGLVFVLLCEVARWLGWEAINPLPVFATGFTAGFVSSVAGLYSDYRCPSSPTVQAGADSAVLRCQERG